jgi:hypothetical protein
VGIALLCILVNIRNLADADFLQVTEHGMFHDHDHEASLSTCTYVSSNMYTL